MSTQWTTDQVTAMAPDAASVKAGRKLGSAGKWLTLGQSDEVLWGEFKGSGSNPYQTCIELEGPAFKCSCPSRKFPCKHALGLAFVFAEQSSALTAGQPPEWVAEWQQKREQRAKKKASKATAADEPVDEATRQRREKAQQKRVASREEKVKAGVEELQRWLQDLVRQGFANQSEQQDPWSKMAARMIDAQAPGLARWLQRTGDLRYQLAHWQEPMLQQVARLHLLLSAFSRRQQLAPELQEDINSLIGYTQSKDELLAQQGVDDTWWVLSQTSELEPQLQMQRTWLWGQHSKRHALLIDFAAMNQVLPVHPNVGQPINAELVFYPGSWPVRALLKEKVKEKVNDKYKKQEQEEEQKATQHESPAPAIAPFTESFSDIPVALRKYSSLLASYPWVAGFPLGLSQVTPLRQAERWLLLDSERRVLPMAVAAHTGWALLAASGGRAVDVFGEWDGAIFQPLSVVVDGAVQNLTLLNLEMAG